jgi:hypothetical protein
MRFLAKIAVVAFAVSLLAIWSSAQPRTAEEIQANPSNYRSLLRNLKPGDTVRLVAGKYPRLPITGLHGTPDAYITITGPETGPPAIIVGGPNSNTVEILNSSYVSIADLRIDSLGIPGAFGISAKEGRRNLTHDIRIEGNVLVGQNGGQQTVGISTKTPTWGWVIRYNQILGAGTGLYLGNSDGTDPFVAGIIEHNLVKDTIGYDMEIKDQIGFLAIDGMPAEPTSTIIRDNVFIKNDQPSPDGDRPNLLVGAFPNAGPGSESLYEIYGNYFLHNPREALFQGSGRFSLHDNIFVDGPPGYAAVVVASQNFPLRIAHVYSNTVFTSGRGIFFGSRAIMDDAVVGNLVFASIPISGPIAHHAGNVVDSMANAAAYIASPSFLAGSMDFYPIGAKCRGAAIDLTPFHAEHAYDVDFNGASKAEAKGAIVFRGAYAGEGDNPGWHLEVGIKPPSSPKPHPSEPRK